MRKVKEVIVELKEMGYDLDENDFKFVDYIRRYGMEIIDECVKRASIEDKEKISNVRVKLSELPCGGLAPDEKQ